MLKRQEPAIRVPLKETQVCRVTLEIDEHDFLVAAYGKLAETMAAVPTGCGLQVEGRLVQHRWKTAQGQPRERVEVEAETVTVLVKPERSRLCRKSPPQKTP